MPRGQKFLIYGIGFLLGCLIVFSLKSRREPREPHPWHAQTAPEGYYPLRITDDFGREVELIRQPRFFVSLAPSITEMLFAMGMGDHLVAVTEWCDYPAEAMALRDGGYHIGAMDRPNREHIAALRPDLILGSTLTPPEMFDTLEQRPRTVAVAFRHERFADVLKDIGTIGRITGVPGKALRLVRELEAAADAIDAQLETVRSAPMPKVLVLLSVESDLQPGWAPGGATWIHDLIERSHGRNVAATMGKSWGDVSFEALLAMDPDVILVQDAAGENGRRQLRDAIGQIPYHSVWRNVSAVRDNRIHILPYGPLNIPGPRIIDAYAAIAASIWPELFEPDLEH